MPFVGLSNPVIIFKIVDLPDPFVPSIPTISPLLILNEISLRAQKSLWNFFLNG
ncbi:hypothetical protein D3C78_1928570 [compost metagenome]